MKRDEIQKKFSHIKKSIDNANSEKENINSADSDVNYSKMKEIIILKLGIDEQKITKKARFVEDLGADSLDTVEIIMDFEEEFDVEIPDEDAEKLTTVQIALDYIEEKLN